MEKNGIIRRIDDLGRIVIPREYRRLHGIDLGDPMEITALDNGEIVVRKVDTDGELVKNFEKAVSPALGEFKGTVLLCDDERWLAGYGEMKNDFVGKNLTRLAAKCVKERMPYEGGGEKEKLIEGHEETRAVFYPAVSGGDCFGAICLVSPYEILPHERTLVKVLAAIIGEYMRRF